MKGKKKKILITFFGFTLGIRILKQLLQATILFTYSW